MRRTVLFISDGTAITAETFGHSLLTQFAGHEFRQVRLPFVDTVEKAREAVDLINRSAADDAPRPLPASGAGSFSSAAHLPEEMAAWLPNS